MKIALLTLGTRGDVQPFAVLGKALKKRGHEVTLATAKNFASFVESYGINFKPVEADFQAILNSGEGKKMMSNPLSARKHLNRLIFPMMIDALNTFYKLSAKSDCVLFHVKAMADYFCDKSKATFIRTNVVPAIEPTNEFINPVFSSWNLPSSFNRISYRLTELGLKMMNKPINDFRQKIGLTEKYHKPALPSIYAISPHFLSEPKDYPETSHFTGFWFDSSEEPLDSGIVDFVHAGEPPLLFTLGSMPFESKLDLPAALNKLTKELGTRIIVVQGWGLNAIGELEKNCKIKVIRSAPYDKLLPLVKAVIQHGGIGTISACLNAGKPFLTCPVLYPLGDQHFWGMEGYKKGVGLKPLPLKKMTEEKLLHAVKILLSDEKLYKNSEEIKEKLSEENGINNAIKLIEQYCGRS
jgi:sterol 3beta-glucosyltransferase